MHIYRTSTCHPLPAIFSSPSPIVVYDQHPLSRLSVASVRKASPVTTPAPLTRKIVWFGRIDVPVRLVCRGPVAVGRRPRWRVVSSLPPYLALVDNIVAVSGARHAGARADFDIMRAAAVMGGGRRWRRLDEDRHRLRCWYVWIALGRGHNVGRGLWARLSDDFSTRNSVGGSASRGWRSRAHDAVWHDNVLLLLDFEETHCGLGWS